MRRCSIRAGPAKENATFAAAAASIERWKAYASWLRRMRKMIRRGLAEVPPILRRRETFQSSWRATMLLIGDVPQPACAEAAMDKRSLDAKSPLCAVSAIRARFSMASIHAPPQLSVVIGTSTNPTIYSRAWLPSTRSAQKESHLRSSWWTMARSKTRRLCAHKSRASGWNASPIPGQARKPTHGSAVGFPQPVARPQMPDAGSSLSRSLMFGRALHEDKARLLGIWNRQKP